MTYKPIWFDKKWKDMMFLGWTWFVLTCVGMYFYAPNTFSNLLGRLVNAMPQSAMSKLVESDWRFGFVKVINKSFKAGYEAGQKNTTKLQENSKKSCSIYYKDKLIQDLRIDKENLYREIKRLKEANRG